MKARPPYLSLGKFQRHIPASECPIELSGGCLTAQLLLLSSFTPFLSFLLTPAPRALPNKPQTCHLHLRANLKRRRVYTLLAVVPLCPVQEVTVEQGREVQSAGSWVVQLPPSFTSLPSVPQAGGLRFWAHALIIKNSP